MSLVGLGRSQSVFDRAAGLWPSAQRTGFFRSYWRQWRRDKTLPENTGQNSWEINGADGRDRRGRNYPVSARAMPVSTSTTSMKKIMISMLVMVITIDLITSAPT